MKNKLKIGLDIHNVIDLYPKIFTHLASLWISQGHEVHIVTGQELYHVENILEETDIPYSHFFSIVGYHLTIGTEMWKDDNERWWMEGDTWDNTKGKYAKRVGLDIHFDDSLIYCKYFPQDCLYMLVGNDAEKTLLKVLDNFRLL